MKRALGRALKSRCPHQYDVSGLVGDFPCPSPLPVVAKVKSPLAFEDEETDEISISRAILVRGDADLADAVSLQHEIVEIQPAFEWAGQALGQPRIPC